jgi:tetratricopeptide (TPR) repeat protein
MADGAKPGRNEETSVESVLRLAHRHLKAGRFNDAIPALLQASRLLPDNPVVFDDLGRACLLTRRLPEALTWLRRAIALRPTFARTHYSLGLALAQTGDYEAALAAHRRAIELEPRLAEAHGRAADILLRKGKRDEAVAEYERAFEVAPGTTFGRLCGAKAMVAQDRPGEAEERLRQLIENDSSSSEAHLVLAHILNEAGRFDEAAASFERSIALAPWQATAYGGLVSSRRLTEADRPLVARILSRLEAADVAERQRMTLHFAAGKALDDLRDYAGAIQHFDAANQIRRRLSPAFDRKFLEHRIDRTIARYSRELFAAHAAMGQDDETPVLILGMPRSGTTLVERIVSSHPRIGGGGELTFWNERASAWVDVEMGKLAEAADSLRGDYLRLLRSIGPGSLRVTDKMPFNFLWIGLVRLLFPNARFIHCRRNPIDTCLSIYSTQFTQSWGYASDRGDLLLSPVPPADGALAGGASVRSTARRRLRRRNRGARGDRETPHRILRSGVGPCVPPARAQPGRREDGQHVAGASTDLPHLGGTLAELRTVDRRASSLASGSVVSGDFPVTASRIVTVPEPPPRGQGAPAQGVRGTPPSRFRARRLRRVWSSFLRWLLRSDADCSRSQR